MALNRELFQKIHDIIQAEGGAKFQMSTWEGGCGTTRCIAGWAVHLETGAPLYQLDGETSLSPETLALAERFHSEGVWMEGADDFETMGGELLGLDESQRKIFYVGNVEAEDFVRAAAEGDMETVNRITRGL